MPTPRLTIPADHPGARRAQERIIEHQRRARDDHALACRILDLVHTSPRVEDAAKLVRLARLLDYNAGHHARMASHLAAELAEVCASLQP